MSAAPALQALQQRLGHTFADVALLQRALTHRSFGADHNERLEFLGDAVLGLAVAARLFARLQRSDEGDLSRVRAHLVREESLHEIALKLELPSVLRVSEAEARGGGRGRASLLADAVEAILAAVYLDAGWAAAQSVVDRLFGERLDAGSIQGPIKDPKTALQEWLQGRRIAVPIYRIVAATGQAHDQTFDVACEIPQLAASAVGRGKSRRAAEQEAARLLLARLEAGEGSVRPMSPPRR